MQKALTPQEVADILQISKNTVYELIKRGELSGYRVGKKVRVDRSDVESYKNKTRPSAAEPAAAGGESARKKAGEAIGEAARGFVICGQDLLLDVLSREVEQRVPGLRTLRSYLGSYNGIYSLYRGEVQVATAHLWDAETGAYNLPFVRRMLPGTHAMIYRLVSRMEGFYVAKGNPRGIRGWDDLHRSDITLVNREQGSGARVLLDGYLQKLGIDGRRLPGYGRECTSHLMVASTVARGGGDFGIGIEQAALQVANVDFVPLQKENLDLIFKKEDADLPAFRAIVEAIRSPRFAEEIALLGRYDLSGLGELAGET